MHFIRNLIVWILTWEARLVLKRYQPRVIAVTGTKGKSTTTSLIGFFLECLGQEAHTLGNLGNAAMTVPQHPFDPARIAETATHDTGHLFSEAPRPRCAGPTGVEVIEFWRIAQHRRRRGESAGKIGGAVAVEQVFFQNNVRTAMGVGQASGLALAAASAAGCAGCAAGYSVADGDSRRAEEVKAKGLRIAPEPFVFLYDD